MNDFVASFDTREEATGYLRGVVDPPGGYPRKHGHIFDSEERRCIFSLTCGREEDPDEIASINKMIDKDAH